MSLERRIALDVAVPDFGTRAGADANAGGLASGKTDAQTPPDARDAEQFRQALARSAVRTDATPAAAAPELPLPAPFGLFRPAAQSAAAPAHTPAASAPLTQHIEQAVQRLLVSDDSQGRRQVRIELKDEVLPGVSVLIEEAEGRLQVDFVCSVESSRLRLNAQAHAQASTLAERLRRAVLIRVQTDDEEDPCLLEAAASP